MNGTFAVGTDTITIERDPTLAANNGLEQRWTIPLARVTGSVLSDYKPGTGRLSVEIDNVPAPPPTQDAIRRDRNTVTFFARHRDAFTALHQWLLHVADVNRRTRPAPISGAGPSQPAQNTALCPDTATVSPSPPVMNPDAVVPSDPVVQVQWQGPPGWPDFPRGWRRETRWFLAGGSPDIDPEHAFWTVTGPPEVAASVATVDVRLPEEWQESGPPSTKAYVEWLCTTVEGRADLLNSFERLICRYLEYRSQWEEDDTVSGLAVRVPRGHPAVLARSEAWDQLMDWCVAARDWALWTLVTASSATPELIAWYEWIRSDNSYWEARKAVDDVVDDLRDQRLSLMSPEQRHRYWWGDGSGPTGEADWQRAERLAEVALRRIGFIDATRTPPGADKGLDVVSDNVGGVRWSV